VSELVENILFWDLLYSSQIILNLIENPEFLCHFLETKGVSRICLIPHCLVSSSNASLLLSTIMEKSAFRINYGIAFFGCPNTKKTCKIVENVFNNAEYYKIFINQNGIKLILEN
ncbi:hypothetical protein MXB_544, partial [Myxobolus squamalis]